jgi:hypothetical protein
VAIRLKVNANVKLFRGVMEVFDTRGSEDDRRFLNVPHLLLENSQQINKKSYTNVFLT